MIPPRKPAPPKMPVKQEGDGYSYFRGSTRTVHEPEPVERVLHVVKDGVIETRLVPMKAPIGYVPPER